MSFAYPAWFSGLWLVAISVLLTAYAQRRRSRILGAFARCADRERLVADVSPRRRWVDGLFLAAAVFFMVAALAGPRYGYRWRISERRGVDLIVAVDCSRSMLATDVSPSRLDRAKREVLDLLDRLEGDRIGLVAFAGTAFLQCPLTLDYSGLHIFLEELSPDFLPVGGTALAEAIHVALDSFDAHSGADRAILILTDGQQTTGAAEKAVDEANRQGVKVYVVGVGTADGAPVPGADGGFVRDREGNIVMARLDEDALQRWAVDSGGAYVRSVVGDEDRDAIYERMRADLELKTLASRKVKIWEERFQWPLALAAGSVFFVLAGPAYAPLRRRKRWFGFLLVLAVASLLTRTAAVAGVSTDVRDGLQQYQEGKYEAAEESFLRAQVEAPDAAEIAFNLGTAQYRSGNFEAARKSFTAAAGKGAPELRAKALYNRGNAAFKLGQYEDAMGDYRSVLELDSENENALLNLAFAERMLQQQQQEQQQQAGSDSSSQEAGSEGGEKTEREGRQEGDPSQTQGGSMPQSRPAAASGTQEQGVAPPSDAENGSRSGNNDPTDGTSGEKMTAGGLETGDGEPNSETPVEDEGGQEGVIGRQRARALLNRLNDQPGKALLPQYREQKVEKDW